MLSQVCAGKFLGSRRSSLARAPSTLDISGGHSGSPNWTDYPGRNGPYVIGIAMWEHCFTCEDALGDIKTHPNGFRGMTPYLANLITDKRIAYP
jgi:hypothetical protein